MGTNFFLMTRSKEVAEKYAPYSYELTDEPYFGYQIHIAKTSGGWLPLFQGHKCGIMSVREYKTAYDDGLEIYDEYNNGYTWDEFDKRVLQFNGGVKGAVPIQKLEVDKNDMYYDTNCPEHIPISHFEYGNGKYAYECEYFTDKDCYEFSTKWFR